MLGRVAAFIPITIAVGAAGAGWWLLGGLLLATCLAYSVQRAGLPDSPPRPRDSQAASVRLLTTLNAASRMAVLAVCAAVFGDYVVPQLGWAGPAAFVLVVVVARVAGVTIHPTLLAWGGGLLLVGALAFVALSFAVAPASAGRPATGLGPPGVLFAAAVAFPAFAGGGVLVRSWRLLLGVVLGLAVATAALYQIGPFRLGLSPTSMRDVLAAADAQLLLPALAVVVALATLRVALAALEPAASERSAPGARGRAATAVPAGLVAVVLAAVLGPAAALILTAVLALVEVPAAAAGRTREPAARVAVGLSVLLLAGLSLPLLP